MIKLSKPRSTYALRSFIKHVIECGKAKCWEWDGTVNGRGYAILSSGTSAHRFSYEMYKGPIPEGMCVLHTCNNPPCCNPEHLWLGTRADNSKDMAKKGRNGH